MEKGYNRYNHLNNRRLTPRQKQIIIRKIGTIISAFIFAVIITLTICSAGAKAKAADNYHKYYKCVEVQPGDTLTDYYKEYGTQYKNSNDYLKEVYMINSLTNDKIVAGTYLTIPYHSVDIK